MLLCANGQHVDKHESTLLCRFLGLHSLQTDEGREFFVVMAHVFSSPERPIHLRYDLKVRRASHHHTPHTTPLSVVHLTHAHCAPPPPHHLPGLCGGPTDRHQRCLANATVFLPLLSLLALRELTAVN